jgi:hypothetical protein
MEYGDAMGQILRSPRKSGSAQDDSYPSVELVRTLQATDEKGANGRVQACV